MAFDYLSVMARASKPNPPRVLASSKRPGWCSVTKPVSQARVALLTSAALRLSDQPPFTAKEDLSYRLVPADPNAGTIVIDHHSRIGAIPRQDPEIIFPRSALTTLAAKRVVGSVSPVHVSFLGGMRCHQEIENELAPAIVGELVKARVDLALLVPY
jgi:D-proline reductase (dithiol) PrdB